MAHLHQRNRKTEELKTKVPPFLYEKVIAAAAEDGLMKATLVREAIEHFLTMREVRRRIKSHQSSDVAA